MVIVLVSFFGYLSEILPKTGVGFFNNFRILDG